MKPVPWRAAWLLAAASCTGTTMPELSAAPSAAPPPAGPSLPVEITLADEVTDAKGMVVKLGKPRLMYTDESSGTLAVSSKGGLIATNVANAIEVWDLASGVHKQRLVPQSRQPELHRLPRVRMSPDGRWVTGELPSAASFFEVPFRSSTPTFTMAITTPLQFSADSKLLAVEGRSPAIVDLAQRQIIAAAEGDDRRTAFDGCVSANGQTVWIAKRTGIERWDRAANQRTWIYKAPTKLKDAAIAAGQSIAVVAVDKQLVRVDLATGAAKPIGPFDTTLFAVSASGKWVAMADAGAVRVVDTDTGADVWKAKAYDPARVAFAPDAESLLVYNDNATIRVADVPKGVRTYPEPARFAGWLGDGIVAIKQSAALQKLTLSSRETAPIDATTLAAAAPALPRAAPNWASWISADPAGAVAAEPVERHGAPIELRYDRKCPAALRVWTPKGGTKTLRYTPADENLTIHHSDPCWELGGGRVLALSVRRATVFDPVTGKRVLEANVGTTRRVERPEFVHVYYAAAMDPTGNYLALVWRRADIAPEPAPDPRRDVYHQHEAPIRCDEDSYGNCQLEYLVDMWSLAGKPKRIWQHRFDSELPTGQVYPLAKIASGAVAFTRDGSRVLVGFEDGDIEIRSAADGKNTRVEHLHHAPIRRIEVGPGNSWVFSEDRAGEQRAWQLPPP